MSSAPHLVVENGRQKGMKITVPPEGARLGRSSKNDIVLLDPLLSRHHCRLFLKPGEGLWVADLGSANETLVNGAAVRETRLHKDDKILVGDTELRVLSDRPAGAGGAVVDLGLGKAALDRCGPGIRRSWLLAAAGVVVVAALAVWIPRMLKPGGARPAAVPAPVAAPEARRLAIEYEKVLADAGNIFRYRLSLSADGIMGVAIDDLQNDRHVRKEARADEEYLASLADAIENAGFFSLDENYQGVQPDIFNRWDLRVTIGKRTHRSIVFNRVEPDIFRDVRKVIEEAGKNELGLWAIQFSPEKLAAMARDAHLLGRKLYDERSVKHGNLAAALKSFEEAAWYLETVEPKPEHYAETVAMINTCKEDLQSRYEDQNFRAERAIKLRDWETAARELRVLCEMIPDRTDPRNKEARRKLLDVESRIEGLR